MATRTLSRRALRDQHAAVESDRPDTDEADDTEDGDSPKPRARKKTAKAKAPAKPRARKKAEKTPQRTIARWAVCDNGAKRVAVFEYRDRTAAEVKLAEVRERKPGTYFLLLVKDPYEPLAEVAAPA